MKGTNREGKDEILHRERGARNGSRSEDRLSSLPPSLSVVGRSLLANGWKEGRKERKPLARSHALGD